RAMQANCVRMAFACARMTLAQDIGRPARGCYFLLLKSKILMNGLLPQSEILYISTFPPVKCGIASFTEDLITATQQRIDPAFAIRVCALNSPPDTSYDAVVSMQMDGYSSESCISTADAINSDLSIKMVCIEHEFGLFG